MPTKKKIEQVEELADLFSNPDTIIMAEYKGSSVSDLSSFISFFSDCYSFSRFDFNAFVAY